MRLRINEFLSVKSRIFKTVIKTMKFLLNKTVIVTGGSSGIGLEISKLLIQKYDCKVIAIGRSLDKLEKCQKMLGKNYITIQSDLSKAEEWKKLGEFVKNSTLSPSILINNAGMMLPFIKESDYTESDFSKIIDTNLMSVVNSILYVLPNLHGEKGIVNISSSSALCPVIGQGGYCMTKSAVKSLTEVLQTEAKYYVSLIMPGFCKTDIMRSVKMTEKDKKLIDAFSMSSEKCAKKIVRAIDKKRKRKVIGIDAHLMNFMYKISPKAATKIIAKVLLKSKLQIFDNLN